MARQLSKAAQFPTVELLNAAADAAGRTGTYVSLRNCAGKAWITCKVTQGNAATVLFSVLQAKDTSGTSSKAINATAAIWADQDTVTSDALVSQTAAATFTTSAAVKNKIVIFEIVPERDMDVANGFNHITVSTGASNAANITVADIELWGSIQAASPPPANI